MNKKNEKLTERLDRVRANHREELLHWQRTNSKLDDTLEERENLAISVGIMSDGICGVMVMVNSLPKKEPGYMN